jgi:hypothetical protein
MNVVAKAAQQAITLLNALKADFKIILPTGEEYGNLEVVRPKERTRVQHNKRGSLFAIYEPIINSMQVGDVKVVAIPEGVAPEHIRGAISGYASHHWGAGSAKTCVNDNAVEILRVL